MVSIFSKFFIFINIFFLMSIHAVSEQRVLNFERDCLSEDREPAVDCSERHQDLVDYLAQEESPEASVGACAGAEGAPTPEGLEALSEDITIASAKMSCTEEDQKEVEGSCGEQLFCNFGRTAVRVLKNLPIPSVVARKTSEFFSNQVSESAAATCSDQNNSDCLTELFTSYISNLVGTFNGLRDIASAASSAFWGMKDYLFKKSDNLHEAASSTVSGIGAFIRSPGKYIMEKFSSLKKSVDGWIKSEVFCQKWEREPHAIPTAEERQSGKTTTCEKPLEAYSCLNCNDGINAFCAGAGLFLSEGMIAMVTAGAASTIRIGARAGAIALRSAAASRKGAKAITDKVPLMAKLSSEASTTARAGASLASDAAVTTSRVAKVSVGYDKVRRVVDAFADKMLNNRVARVITAPVRVVDDVAARMVERTTRRAALIKGQGALASSIRTAARGDFAEGIVKRGGRTQIDLNRATGPRRVITGSRFARRSGGPGGGNPDSRVNGNSSPTDRSTRDGSDGNEPDARTDTRSPGDDPRTARQQEEYERSRARENERENERQAEAQRQREREREEERERQRIAALESASLRNRTALNATRAALAADVAAKSAGALQNGANQYAEKLLSEEAMNAANGVGAEQGIGSDVKGAIEARVGESFSDEDQASQFAQNMNELYSDPDQESKIVESFVAERGLTREQAQRAYESEKDFYGRAADSYSQRQSGRNRGITDTRRRPSSTTRIEEEELITSEIIDVAKSIGRIKQSLSEMKEQSDFLDELEKKSTNSTNGAVSSRGQVESSAETPVAKRASSDRSGAMRGPRPTPSKLAAQSLLPTSGDNTSEEISAEVIAEEIDGKPSVQDTPKSEESVVDEEKRQASLLRIERAEILSDLMRMLGESEQPRFSQLRKDEVALLTPYKDILATDLEIEKVRSLKIKSGGRQYFAFKDLASGRSIIVEKSGRLIKDLPMNLF